MYRDYGEYLNDKVKLNDAFRENLIKQYDVEGTCVFLFMDKFSLLLVSA